MGNPITPENREVLPESMESKLLAYYSGSVSESERREIEKWIQESSENKKLAKDVQYINFASDTLDVINHLPAEEALVKVKQRIYNSSKAQVFVWIQRIAAILVLPLLLSTLYFALKKEPIEEIKLQTNPGMIGMITLSDGSKVWLNSATTLVYPRKFSGDNREVILDGEAYFSVEKDPSKKFIVHTSQGIKAEVLGTEFNIEAYNKDKEVTTTLISGSVRLLYQDKNGKELTQLLNPGEEITYDLRTKGIDQGKPYIPTLTAWKDGLVIFRNTSLEEALKILGKQFNVEFIVKNVSLYENSFTGPFDGQNLLLIMEHFRLSSGIQYRFIDPEESDDLFMMNKSIVELY